MIKYLVSFIFLLTFEAYGQPTAMQGMMVGQMANSVASQAGDSRTSAMVGSAVNIGMGGWMARSNCNPNGDQMSCMMGIMMLGQGVMHAQSAGDAAGVESDVTDYMGGLRLPAGADLNDPSTWPPGWEPPGYDPNNWPPPGGIPGTGNDTGVAGVCDASPEICDALDPYDSGMDLNNLSPTDLTNLGTRIQDDMSRRGYRLDPSGQSVEVDGMGSVSTAALSDPSALTSAGYDKDKVNSLFSGIDRMSQNFADQLKASNGVGDAPSVASMGFKSGGGAGGRSRYKQRAFQDLEMDAKDPFADMMKKFAKKRKPAATAAGMIRRLPNGETIGAKGDNIFEMVHRRYRQKARQNIFMKP